MRVHHRMAGRLRISIPVLRGDAVLTQRVVEALEADTGIRSVRANPACASIVIHHRLETLSGDQLEAHIVALLEPWLVSEGHQGSALSQSTRQAQWKHWKHRQEQMQGQPQAKTRIAQRRTQAANQGHANDDCPGFQHTERGRERSTAIRQPLTWPLADLSRGRRQKLHTAAPLTKTGLRKKTALCQQKPAAVGQVVRAWTSIPERCWLCDLSQYLLRGLLRFSLRCWWRDQRRALAQRFAGLQRIRSDPLWQRLRFPSIQIAPELAAKLKRLPTRRS